MPHQCTDCGRVFDDGSTEMLSGCPGCSGTTFQYHPDAADLPDQPTADPPQPPERPGEGSVAQKVGSAATTVRDIVGSSSSSSPPSPSSPSGGSSQPSPSSRPTSPPSPTSPSAPADPEPAEDEAQASARSELVSPDELPATSGTQAPSRQSAAVGPRPDADADASARPERPPEERPDLSELRAELNDQFESIKVLKPGQYELNLMSLYDREEYIIALQEDGKYTIQVPERWKGD